MKTDQYCDDPRFLLNLPKHDAQRIYDDHKGPKSYGHLRSLSVDGVMAQVPTNRPFVESAEKLLRLAVYLEGGE